MNKFRQEYPVQQITPPHPASYAERQFLHTPTAGIWLPLGQALTTAMLIGLGVFTIACVVFDAIDPFTPTGISIVAVLVIGWMTGQRRWISLTKLENVFNVDLNGDDEIGEPPEPETVHIQLEEVRENGHYHADIFDLPASRHQLETLAMGLLNNMPASEKQWTGKGKPFSSNEFRSLRNEMVKRGLLAYANPKDPRQGYALTKPGRAVMKHFLSPSPTPQPETDEN